MVAIGAPRSRNGHGRVVLLLAIAVFFNYADRGNLSTVAPALKGELGISNAWLGVLLSSFFWVYAPAQLVAGSFAQRLDVRRVLAIGLGLWSLATLLTGLASGLVSILLLRLMLGAGEAAIFPCTSRILAEAVPEAQRGKANGLITSGMAIGPMAGTFAGGLILAHFGWRWVFVSFGIVSLAWLWPWLTTRMPPALPVEPKDDHAPPTYTQIMSQRAAWGAALGHFSTNYSQYLVLTWLPIFLVKGQGFSLTEMATIGAIVYLAQALGSLFSGWISDRLIAHGARINGRRVMILIGTAGAGLALLGAGLTSGIAAAVMMIFAGFFIGTMTPMVYSIAQTLAGPRAGGRWMGLQNFIANLAGIIAPIVTGWLVDRTGSYLPAFIVAALVALVGLISWGLIIPAIRPVQWKAADDDREAVTHLPA